MARAKRTLPLDRLAELFPGLLDLAGRVTATTQIQYQRDAGYYLAYCGGDIERARKANELRAWRQWMVEQSELSPNTINRRIIAVRRLVEVSATLDQFDHAEAYRFSLVEPVKRSALRHRLREHARVRLSPRQIRAICSWPDTDTLVGLRDTALLFTLASSACRISEVVTLTQSSILPSGDHWLLEVLGKGKHEPRQAPLSKEAYAWIQRWLRARAEHRKGIDCPAIFTTFSPAGLAPRAKPLSRFGAYQRVRYYARLEGLDHIKPHDFRRAVATQLTAKVGLRQAQLALGHSSPATTQLYVLDRLAGGMTEELF